MEKNYILRHIALGFLILFGISTLMAAYTPESVPNPKQMGQDWYVCNPNAIINTDDVAYLNRCAKQLEETTGAELCVVALDDIGDYDAFDFCYELFQRWGIGKEGKNTGILLFLAMESRDVRIMTGGGIEGILTDAVCNQIINKNMLPALRDGDYSGGLCLGALRIYEVCTSGDAPEELRNASSVTNRYKYADTNKDGDISLVLLMLGLLCGGGLLLLVPSLLRKHFKKCPKCGKRSMRLVQDQVITVATYRRAGTGVRTYKCRRCGHCMQTTYQIPKKSRVDISDGGNIGGGFGGFGGGGFSGGGSFGGGSTFGGGAGGRF